MSADLIVLVYMHYAPRAGLLGGLSTATRMPLLPSCWMSLSTAAGPEEPKRPPGVKTPPWWRSDWRCSRMVRPTAANMAEVAMYPGSGPETEQRTESSTP